MSGKKSISRRSFIQSIAAAGAGLMLTNRVFSEVATGAGKKPDELNVALIGAGSQGRVLMMACLKIPGVRFKAVCDIWPYHQKYAKNILKKFKQPVNVYEDYRELLSKEKDLDAVIVATPDWVHEEQTAAALAAGCHVYCEKEMAHTLESCRAMVAAAKKSGNLLQIGHQRRSNPRYIHAKRFIDEEHILGRITHVHGQWNRAVQEPLGWPKKYIMDAGTLKRWGYNSMEQFRNWRNFKKFSGGPMSDLGSHQVDIFNWFLSTNPSTVQANSGVGYYKDRDWPDTVLATYGYETKDGKALGFYQVANTTSFGGFFETFMGTEGTIVISEDPTKNFLFREVKSERKEWEDEADKVSAMGRDAIELKVGETRLPDGTVAPESIKMAEDMKKPAHQPHLENFFDTIRGTATLNCPVEEAYATAVTVLRANDAAVAKKELAFGKKDFTV